MRCIFRTRIAILGKEFNLQIGIDQTWLANHVAFLHNIETAGCYYLLLRFRTMTNRSRFIIIVAIHTSWCARNADDFDTTSPLHSRHLKLMRHRRFQPVSPSAVSISVRPSQMREPLVAFPRFM